MNQGTRSRQGWGAPWWRWGHSVIECCEFERSDVVWVFDRAWPVLLPCAKCRRHYCGHVRTYGSMRAATTARGGDWRRAARNWLIDVHNAVNRHLGKPQLTRAEARRAIARFKGVRHETPFVVASVRGNLRANRPASAAKQRERLDALVKMLKSKGFNSTPRAPEQMRRRVDGLRPGRPPR